MHGEAWGFSVIGLPALVVWLLVAAVIVVPFWRILPRAGLPAWLSLLALFPFLALALLWIMALKRWPGDETREA
jgi:hypothetical protein